MQIRALHQILYRNLTKIISIIISFGIIIFIYFKIDFSSLIKVFKNSNVVWLIISLSMIIPTTLLTSIRFRQLLPSEIKIKFIGILGLILSASIMNIFLPAKMGDIAKSYFMKNTNNIDGTFALSIVIFEKTCDLLALLVFCLVGLIIYPVKSQLFWSIGGIIIFGLISGFLIMGSKTLAKIFFTTINKISPQRFKKKISHMSKSWLKMQTYFFNNKIRLLSIIINSLFIWFLHLLQFWFFIFALNEYVPFFNNMTMASLSILAGLIPLTVAGIGTRDAAIIIFYNPFFNSAIGAALGILATSRYLIPAIVGIPFFGKYLSNIKINKDKFYLDN